MNFFTREKSKLFSNLLNLFRSEQVRFKSTSWVNKLGSNSVNKLRAAARFLPHVSKLNKLSKLGSNDPRGEQVKFKSRGWVNKLLNTLDTLTAGRFGCMMLLCGLAVAVTSQRKGVRGDHVSLTASPLRFRFGPARDLRKGGPSRFSFWIGTPVRGPPGRSERSRLGGVFLFSLT